MGLMNLRVSHVPAAVVAVCAAGLSAQVIVFESSGLRYQTLSKNGITVMFAYLPAHLHDYQIIQVGVSNGSQEPCKVRPEDFIFERAEGTRVYATPAKVVVDHLLDHATRNDVIKLINTYENSLNGVPRLRSTNGYEARRESALTEVGSAKVKAAAAASAIAFVETRLEPGESTDGAVFFAVQSKLPGAGRLLVHMAGQVFEFESEPSSSGKALQQRGPAEPNQPKP
jgi:hypothetical protein